MTLEEYKARLADLEREHKAKRNELARNYAMSNNPYKIGDILQDHYQIIKVDTIKWTMGYNAPECVYLGVQLTKNLVPKKRQDDSPAMYQSNVKRKLN